MLMDDRNASDKITLGVFSKFRKKGSPVPRSVVTAVKFGLLAAFKSVKVAFGFPSFSANISSAQFSNHLPGWRPLRSERIPSALTNKPPSSICLKSKDFIIPYNSSGVYPAAMNPPTIDPADVPAYSSTEDKAPAFQSFCRKVK